MTLPTIELPTSPAYDGRRGWGEHWPCAVCGRPLQHPRAWVHLVDGGTQVCDPEAEYHDPAADVGWHPVGPECLRNFPELKPYVLKEQPS